ncbi:uncharacterized protein LOC126617108 [Malus sylvestris]|uniref:uncharacterized protein LOC126617108 n=1 Tax=Malus sylvestris TaxID=3752 RepID=UPI0021AD2BF4|nr:uncharacterized protein LOC126617108 [Malus sylvestris]
MAPDLPRYVVLQSRYNAEYLSYVKEDEQIHGFLKFSGEEVVSTYAKFHVEMAKSSGATKGLVHIRCCYNNKYWVRRLQTHNWIVAGADEPLEDESKCPPYDSCLIAASGASNSDLCDACLIVNWDSLLVLPKYIALKSNNGRYLSAQWIELHPYLQFKSDDIGDPTVGNEVFHAGDGSVRIKSNHHGKFWRRSPNWIWPDSELHDNENNKDLLFWPVKLDGKFLALRRNLGNNFFLQESQRGGGGEYNCLNAAVPTITQDARLELEEVVVSRSFYNVNFHVLDARVYNQRVVTMATGDAINRAKEQNTVDMKLSYKEIRSSTWNTSVSFKSGIKTTMETGVPLIAHGQIEVSAKLRWRLCAWSLCHQ